MRGGGPLAAAVLLLAWLGAGCGTSDDVRPSRDDAPPVTDPTDSRPSGNDATPGATPGQGTAPEDVSIANTFVGADAMFVLGWQRYQEHDYDGAISHFTEALSEDPGHVPSLNGLGVTYYQLEHYEEAVSCLRRAAQIAHASGARGREAEALFNLALCYGQEERWRDGVLALEQALAANPQHRGALYYLPRFRQTAVARGELPAEPAPAEPSLPPPAPSPGAGGASP